MLYPRATMAVSDDFYDCDDDSDEDPVAAAAAAAAHQAAISKNAARYGELAAGLRSSASR